MWGTVATGLLGLASKVADSLFETEKEKAAGTVAVLQALQTVDLAQLELSRAEAAHRSLFVAGWRPAIGWTCAFAVSYQFVAMPLLTWAFALFGWEVPPLPPLDSFLWELMFGMIGIAGLRSYEKVKGVAK